jgi:hypothetical protein
MKRGKDVAGAPDVTLRIGQGYMRAVRYSQDSSLADTKRTPPIPGGPNVDWVSCAHSANDRPVSVPQGAVVNSSI